MILKKYRFQPILAFIFFFFSSYSSSQCFQIESILVDACGGQEGLNEMVRFKVGATAINTNILSVDWPNNPWVGLIQNATTASKTAILNADILDAGGCGQLIEPTGGILPANARVILVTSMNLDTSLNSFGALTETIYIIYQNNPTTATGHFANSGVGLRTLTLSFGACSDTVTYDRALLIDSSGATTAGDGAIVQFTATGTATYINNGCAAPVQPFLVNAGPTSINACAGATINLVGTAEGQSSVIWTADSGSFASPNSLATTYTLSPSASGTIVITLTAINSCGLELSDVINVNVTNSNTPTFTTVAPICPGDALAALPTTSTNGITGSWSPALNNLATTTYTFTPNAGQCAASTTLTIVVNSSATPTFTAVAPICPGDALTALPTTSNNGITGSWSPALNNQATTTYMFTPTAGQCAASTTLTIVVNSSATPTFTAVAPICPGDALAALPTTSTNGITGSWSPILNNLATTTYTFTPNAGQCAASTTVTIVVNSSIIPDFPSFINLCSGEAAPVLESISPNGISGSWTPSVINTAANQEYTFTPNPGQCAQPYTLTVQVSSFTFSIGTLCVDGDYYLEAIGATNEFTYEWTNKDGVIVGTDSDLNVTEVLSSISVEEYPVTFNLKVSNTEGCSLTKSELVYSIFCRIPKGISPNNDDKNDTFDLTGLGVKELIIFNRYGTEVFRHKNYTNQWKGNSNGGMELSDGTYFYIIDNGSGKNLTGWVYLIR